MRAIYVADLSVEVGSEVLILDDQFHHLVKVARVKNQDEILLLNGQGLICTVEIVEIQKKKILSIVRKIEQTAKAESFDLLIGSCKKDYLEQILRMCVEIGVNQIGLFKSDYSQNQELREDRIQKILISALEQSNNPYKPNIIEINTSDELQSVCSSYDCVLWFNSHNRNAGNIDFKRINSAQKIGILIGPEGGFSSKEESLMSRLPQFIEIHLEGPIMKAITAVPVAAGYLLACRAKRY